MVRMIVVTGRFISQILISLIVFAVTVHADQVDSVKKSIGRLNGVVVAEKHPVSLGIVSFFNIEKGLPVLGEGMRRVPDAIVRADLLGRFNASLVYGSYYMGILLRRPGAPPGPPRSGETIYFAGDDQGSLRRFIVSDAPLDVGIIEGSTLESLFQGEENLFSIGGRVVNGISGESVPGVLVLGKASLKQVRPDFLSRPTGQDGDFLLYVAAGQSVYLVARKEIGGGRPVPGDLIGAYGLDSAEALIASGVENAGQGSPPAGIFNQGADDVGFSALVVKGGKGERVTGIVIRMFPAPDPESVQKSIQDESLAPKVIGGQ